VVGVTVFGGFVGVGGVGVFVLRFGRWLSPCSFLLLWVLGVIVVFEVWWVFLFVRVGGRVWVFFLFVFFFVLFFFFFVLFFFFFFLIKPL